jgi:uncharacterized membrane protein YoaK (UPF0700 family)
MRQNDNAARVHLYMMLALTFTTGIVDALGYLGLDRVFTANMTGNVVILAMGLTGVGGLPVVGPVIALALFLVGAAVSGALTRRHRAGWGRTTTAVFATTATIALALGITSLFVRPVPQTPMAYVVTAGLAFAMGLQAAAARGLGVKDVTTVVVTSTLTGLAADSRIAGGTGENWARRVLAVVLIGVGAATGALLLLLGLGVGLIAAGVLIALVAAGGHYLAAVPAPSTPAPSTPSSSAP